MNPMPIELDVYISNYHSLPNQSNHQKAQTLRIPQGLIQKVTFGSYQDFVGQDSNTNKGPRKSKKQRVYLGIQCKNLDVLKLNYQAISIGCSYTFHNSFQKLKKKKEEEKLKEQNLIRGFDQQATDKFKNLSSIELSQLYDDSDMQLVYQLNEYYNQNRDGVRLEVSSNMTNFKQDQSII